ncbi:hypothetical protein Cgig2_026081 [Carnegiea gigantea]|uniref:Uncharacterized protein n=1 Tax=Carnegiea gigantea TaxID=171969 RepID=A0A9Q1QL42_9CARY|nr:hypothetical protein Cgig2_026081 [Carnegiea gigantea]
MSSHKCPKHDAHDFRNKHPFRVIGTRSEFSEPIDEGFYEFDLFHFCRPTKIWFIFATRMKLRMVSVSQKLGPHRTDRRLAPTIARSASPNTKWKSSSKREKRHVVPPVVDLTKNLDPNSTTLVDFPKASVATDWVLHRSSMPKVLARGKSRKRRVEFAWRKKIEKDVIMLAVPLEECSVKAEMKKHGNMMAEIDVVKKRRKRRKSQRFRIRVAPELKTESNPELHHMVSKGLTAKDAEEIHDDMNLHRCLDMTASTGIKVFGPEAKVNLDFQMYWWHDRCRPGKPKYFNRIRKSYIWNKYS